MSVVEWSGDDYFVAQTALFFEEFLQKRRLSAQKISLVLGLAGDMQTLFLHSGLV